MRKYIFGATMIILAAVAACNKDKDLMKAKVVDTGDIASGGCGYLLQLEDGGKIVRPWNLPSAYMHDGYKVKVKYDEDGEGEVCRTYPVNEFIEIVQLTEIKADLD